MERCGKTNCSNNPTPNCVGIACPRRLPTIPALPKIGGSYWVAGWWIASCDEGANQGPEQGFAAAACVMHELKEAEIKRQLVLRDTAVRAQPGAQQRPETLDGIDVDFTEAITI